MGRAWQRRWGPPQPEGLPEPFLSRLASPASGSRGERALDRFSRDKEPITTLHYSNIRSIQ